MANLKLGTDGDLDLSSGGLEIVGGQDAIIQNLKFRLGMVKGDWFLDNRIGIPYFEQVWVKAPSLLALRGLFRRAILTTAGITSLDSFSMNFDQRARQLSISFACVSEAGPITFKDFVL